MNRITKAVADQVIDDVLVEAAIVSALPWTQRNGTITDAYGKIVGEVFRSADAKAIVEAMSGCRTVREAAAALRDLDDIKLVERPPEEWRMAPGDKRTGANYQVSLKNKPIGSVHRHSEPVHAAMFPGSERKKFLGYRMTWVAETTSLRTLTATAETRAEAIRALVAHAEKGEINGSQDGTAARA